jgi:hypothetical protein
MEKVPFGCSHRKSWTSESIVSISKSSRKCYFSGKIQLQKMSLGTRPPFCNNFFISSLEEKVVLQRGGHVRNLTSLIPHIDRIIYFPLIKANSS